MRCRARRGVFCGYPKDTSDGVYTTYFPDTKSTQDSRHCVMDEYHGLRHEATPEQAAERALKLQNMIDELEGRSNSAPSKGQRQMKPLVRSAVESTKYFSANAEAIHRAATQVRRRCEQMHGMLCSDVINTRVPAKSGKLKNYTACDFEYNLRSMWCTAYDEPPPPLAPSGVACAIDCKNEWLRKAEEDAVHPIVDYSVVRGVATKEAFVSSRAPARTSPPTADMETAKQVLTRTSPPTAEMEAVRSGTERRWHFNNEYNEAIAQLTITERETMRLHLQTQENPEFAVEYHTPDGVVTYKVMPGPGPSMDDLAMHMPTLPGPTTYKAAMKSANWRGWLKHFIAEIEGQIEVGCFHWAVLPPGHTLLTTLCASSRRSCTLISRSSVGSAVWWSTTHEASLASTLM
jgi:hypothetical protein